MATFLYNAGADEQRFLEASMAYVSGNPIMSDKDYDKLKLKLKVLCNGPLVVLECEAGY